MLDRRKFIQAAALLAAGAMMSFLPAKQLLALAGPSGVALRSLPPMPYRGHKRSGCAFRPELTDLWAGGGAHLPELL